MLRGLQSNANRVQQECDALRRDIGDKECEEVTRDKIIQDERRRQQGRVKTLACTSIALTFFAFHRYRLFVKLLTALLRHREGQIHHGKQNYHRTRTLRTT